MFSSDMFRLRVDDSIELALLEERHSDEIFVLTDANRQYLRQWLPWLDTVKSVSDTRKFRKQSLKQFAEKNGLQAGIWSQEKLVEVIGLHYIDWPNRATSIGYWIAETEQGKGIVTKACRSLVNYALNDLKLNRVEIRVAPQNETSRRIPQKLGFTFEGILREKEWLYDRFVDLEMYSMLAGDWAETPLEH